MLQRGSIKSRYYNEDTLDITGFEQLGYDFIAKLRPAVCEFKEEIEAYFLGDFNINKAVENKIFRILQNSGFSKFTKDALIELVRIPMGEVLSYTQVAANIGNAGASRAIGNVCATNPLPIVIPCHRVVNSKGGFGSFLYSPRIQEILLEREKLMVLKSKIGFVSFL